MSMLEIRHLNAAYGHHPALQDVSISVGKGEIVAILGANGAGKSTLLRAIAGICEGEVTGEINLSGNPITNLSPDAIVASGLALVPEGRGIFGDLTVRENLGLGAYTARARTHEKENLERVLNLFPKIGERQDQIARTMSGGEQQMVAIGRAMMSAPDILMLDEPSLGLAPVLCQELFQNLAQVKQLDIGILLVEQNARQSLAIADRGYLLENTRITHEDSAARLATDPSVQKAYLGVSASTETVRKNADQTTSESAALPLPDSHPSGAFTTSVGELRRSADQQIGGSIEDLVAAATAATAFSATVSPPAPTGVTTRPVESYEGVNNKPRPATTSAMSSGEVERVTRDIEQAAQEARRRARSRFSSRSIHKNNDGQNQQDNTRAQPANSASVNGSSNGNTGDTKAEGDKAVVVEVYKRPRVEVYRRRPSGEFERK